MSGLNVSDKPTEIRGNKNAAHIIKFEYDGGEDLPKYGGVNYRKFVDDAIDKIEAMNPGVF